MFHWYCKQASSTKECDLDATGKKIHSSMMTFHSSSTFPFSFKLFSWDSPEIPAVFCEIHFSSFLPSVSVNLKTNS